MEKNTKTKKQPSSSRPSLDFIPFYKRIKTNIKIEEIPSGKAEAFCRKYRELRPLIKMKSHELKCEPVKNIVAISQGKNQKIPRKVLIKILRNMGFNVRVLLSYKRNADFDAALNLNGYSLPGWSLIVLLAKKINWKVASLLGKGFGPGKSRLHLRLFEGKKHWYIIAHIDEYNFFRLNLVGIKNSHLGSGAGDYNNGTTLFITMLEKYFQADCIKRISGTVINGNGRGRALKFPTANIKLLSEEASGVYSGLVRIKGEKYIAAIFIKKNLLEAHLLNFSGDLYGERINVCLIEKIRGIMKFKNARDLKRQIKKDVQYIKEYF